MIDRPAFTIIEILVSLAIAGLLLALILPAVQRSRGSADRATCANRLRQLEVAVQNHETQTGLLVWNSQYGEALIPYMDSTLVLTETQAQQGTFSRVHFWQCPADRDTIMIDGQPWSGWTNYHINRGSGYQQFDFNGLVYIAQGTRSSDITDGLSQTAAFAESLWQYRSSTPMDLSQSKRVMWDTLNARHRPGELDSFVRLCEEVPHTASHRGSGLLGSQDPRTSYLNQYDHLMRPNSWSCWNDASVGANVLYSALTPTSNHPGGVNVVFCDGHLQFIGDSIDFKTWRALGSRNGMDIPGPF